ncbi:MAG TPA: NTP transferase domain-containing protein [Acidimicrobiia bacterium]|nr:NTP transferase domain-containing protein [Acidimicrobiia bacterium]
MAAGLLLTGGSSRRMGRDKAELVIAGERLADRTARALAAVCDPVLEVGPGRTGLDAVDDAPAAGAARSGPLAALVVGAAALRAREYGGAVVLLGVDLPFVSEPLLRLVADHPAADTVVPVAGGRRQSCCARYSPGALGTAAELVEGGERALHALLAAVPVVEIREDEWRAVAPPDALVDLDTPEDLARYGVDGAQ